MSQEMVKISFNDWREIGSKLYDSDPEGFKKQAEEAGLRDQQRLNLQLIIQHKIKRLKLWHFLNSHQS